MCFKYHIAKRICRVFLKNWQFSQKKSVFLFVLRMPLLGVKHRWKIFGAPKVGE